MSALDEIILSKKYRQSYTPLESVLMVHKKRYPNDAESAAAELLALRERVEKADKALTRRITFLTNVNTITDDSQIELVKELIDAGRADLADAVSIGGFGSAL